MGPGSRVRTASELSSVLDDLTHRQPSEAVGLLERFQGVDRTLHLGGIVLPERYQLCHRTAVPGDDETLARLNTLEQPG